MWTIDIMQAKCNTVGSRYYAAQYIMTSHTALHWQKQDMNQLWTHKTHTMGCRLWRFGRKLIAIITTSHCVVITHWYTHPKQAFSYNVLHTTPTLYTHTTHTSTKTIYLIIIPEIWFTSRPFVVQHWQLLVLMTQSWVQMYTVGLEYVSILHQSNGMI